MFEDLPRFFENLNLSYIDVECMCTLSIDKSIFMIACFVDDYNKL